MHTQLMSYIAFLQTRVGSTVHDIYDFVCLCVPFSHETIL